MMNEIKGKSAMIIKDCHFSGNHGDAVRLDGINVVESKRSQFQIRMLALCLLFAFLNLADAILTVIALNRFGDGAMEANPIAAALGSIWIYLGLKLVLSWITAYALLWKEQRRILYIVCAGMGLICAWNTIMIMIGIALGG